MESYGFIITRHVNSDITNQYWNHCIQCIRRFYTNKIIVIDDNSKQEFLKREKEYENVEYITSEFPGRGELLPYYYFYKRHFFEKAVIIHDSVFIQKKIMFDKITYPVIPFWHFEKCRNENIDNSIRIIQPLKNTTDIHSSLLFRDEIMETMRGNVKWFGCFGVQSVIDYSFLCQLQKKYDLFQMLHTVRCRKDRCCLERIMGYLFCIEYPALLKKPSLWGPIFTYMKWGYSFEEYKSNRYHSHRYSISKLPMVKVWTGR
jgi:hypothetical protein